MRLRVSSYWNRRLGYAWMRVLQTQEFDPRGTFVEIGPGLSEKIAIGLAALNFRVYDQTPALIERLYS